MHFTFVESLFAGKTVSGRETALRSPGQPLSANCKTPGMDAREIPPKTPPLTALNHWCVPCSHRSCSTGDTCPSLTLFKRKPQPVRYQQLLFHSPVITFSLLLLLLVSLLLLVLLVLLSPSSFFTYVLRGTLYFPKLPSEQMRQLWCWPMWEV